jgi:CRP-like cAMP-binding protein
MSFLSGTLWSRLVEIVDCQSCQHRKAGKSLFSCLGCTDIEKLEAHRSERRFFPGQVLFLQNDEPFGVYCLQSGLVKLEAFSPDGGAQLLRLARPGEPLGYRAYLGGHGQKYRATALTTVQVCAIPAHYLTELTQEVPEFSRSLIQKLTSDLEHAEERWLGLMQKNSEQRVAEILLEFHHAAEGWPSRKDMAHLVDIAPETFTRILSRFEKRGWLFRTRKELELLKFQELENLLENEAG